MRQALEEYLDGGFNEKAVMKQVTNGKNAMPAFGGRLSDDDIANVAAYVISTSEAGWGAAANAKQIAIRERQAAAAAAKLSEQTQDRAYVDALRETSQAARTEESAGSPAGTIAAAAVFSAAAGAAAAAAAGGGGDAEALRKELAELRATLKVAQIREGELRKKVEQLTLMSQESGEPSLEP